MSLPQADGYHQAEQQHENKTGVSKSQDLVSYLIYREQSTQTPTPTPDDAEKENTETESPLVFHTPSFLQSKEDDAAEEEPDPMKQTLTPDVTTLKQNSQQEEDVLQAKEKALLSGRKTLETEKKALQVNYAR
ncbi:hypothetical protein PF008_g27421 [Phytophthora fragariae]|uniref:Uncharacterized protein n=1 Tax=Phytophthora fragariae TaxID=53985 RepID=A0A6G0QEX8_9STRA|nr:hypothetical protein PF008_g27421 [Phytophthora fragariae]